LRLDLVFGALLVDLAVAGLLLSLLRGFWDLASLAADGWPIKKKTIVNTYYKLSKNCSYFLPQMIPDSFSTIR